MGIDIGVVLAVAFIGLSAYVGYQKYKVWKALKNAPARAPVVLPTVAQIKKQAQQIAKKAVATKAAPAKKAAPVAKYATKKAAPKKKAKAK